MPQLDLGSVLGPQGPKGDPGNQGTVGPRGPQGEQGDAGKDATINGVNALTIETGDGLEATMTGSAYNLKLTDKTLNAVRVVPTFTRPNLLDNWYFGRPVDQRGGKIVQQGKMAYRDAACTIEAGSVSETAMAVTKVSDTVYTFKGGDGNPYYVKAADVVRGYTGEVYTINRWKGNRDQAITITDNYLNIVKGNDAASGIMQLFPRETIPNGSTVTLSFLFAPGTQKCRFGLRETTKWGYLGLVDVQTDETHYQLVSVTIPDVTRSTGNFVVWLSFETENPGSVMRPIAAKLELGPTQTLAHQDAAWNWALNEVPNYGEQLARCLRHDYIIGSDTQPCPIGMGTAYSDNSVVADIQLPEYMRTNPAIKISGYVQIRFSATQNFSVPTVENYGFNGDKVQLYFSGLSGLTPGQSCDLYTQAGSKIEFNANL